MAVVRQSQQWAEPDTKDTRRIVERVWQLVKAGRTSEACDMCRSCGQAWRAASIGGGPQGGSTALGAAAHQVLHLVYEWYGQGALATEGHGADEHNVVAALLSGQADEPCVETKLCFKIKMQKTLVLGNACQGCCYIGVET